MYGFFCGAPRGGGLRRRRNYLTNRHFENPLQPKTGSWALSSKKSAHGIAFYSTLIRNGVMPRLGLCPRASEGFWERRLWVLGSTVFVVRTGGLRALDRFHACCRGLRSRARAPLESSATGSAWSGCHGLLQGLWLLGKVMHYMEDRTWRQALCVYIFTHVSYVCVSSSCVYVYAYMHVHIHIHIHICIHAYML